MLARVFGCLTALIGFLCLGANASACPFCANMGKTLAENVAESGMVMYGTLSNAKLIPEAQAGQPDGTTQLTIKKIIKSHPAIEGKTQITLPRFIPAAEKEPVEYVVFAELIDGKIDPYRGMPLDDSDFVEYLAGAVGMTKAEAATKLGFFFKYLDHKDVNISGDAYKEFANAPYADVVKAGKYYDPQRIIGWLKDKDTPSYRIGLYGCLLGICGSKEHAGILLSIIDSPTTRPLTGVDGLMGGYCVLEPKHGPDYVLKVLTDPNNDFNLRYAALRTVRFLLTDLPTVNKADVFAKMVPAIKINDISDLIIDEFRKNKVWSPTETVLGLYGKKEYDLQVIRRSIIRYALKCPDAKAKAFVDDLRKKDPQLLADVEEILKFEETQIQLGSGS